jgi:hypothetical protein
MQLFFLLGGEPLALCGVDLVVVDPLLLLAQCLGREVKIAGYLRNGLLLVGGGVNQPESFLLEFRRVEPASLMPTSLTPFTEPDRLTLIGS